MEQAAAALLLYVEDEVFIQDALVFALTEAGYEVMAVTTGAEGVEVLEGRSAAVRGLITDINLAPA
jgi:CheY-like chemotaxis protein